MVLWLALEELAAEPELLNEDKTGEILPLMPLLQSVEAEAVL